MPMSMQLMILVWSHFLRCIYKYRYSLWLEVFKRAIFGSPGKSALHWAAAVNNVEAAVVLLKNGANKDMQNNKVKAFLFSVSPLSGMERNCRTSFIVQL